MKTNKIPKDAFQHALKNLESCVAKDDSRPILKYIHLVSKKNGIIFETLDGYKMCQVESRLINNDEFECMIPAIKLHKGAMTVEIELDGDWVSITQEFMGGAPIIVEKYKNIKGDYIKTEYIKPQFNKENSFTVSVNAKMLCQVLKDMGDKSCRTPVVDLTFSKEANAQVKPFTITDTVGVFKLLLPVRKE